MSKNRYYSLWYWSTLLLVFIFTIGSILISFLLIWPKNYSTFLYIILLLFSFLIIYFITKTPLDAINHFRIRFHYLLPIFSVYADLKDKKLEKYFFILPRIVFLVFGALFLLIMVIILLLR